MLEKNLQLVLAQAHANGELAERLINADSYAEIETLGRQSGVALNESRLRTAFRTRNAQVLIHQLMRQGLMDAIGLAPVPAMDPRAWSRIIALDLEPVTRQLIRYLGWGETRARAAERRYRRFVFLKLVFPGNAASPSDEIDLYWHQHIINTAKYAADCMACAGTFLHHDFLEPDDPLDAQKLERLRLETWIAYEVMFEEPYEESLGAAFLKRWPCGQPVAVLT